MLSPTEILAIVALSVAGLSFIVGLPVWLGIRYSLRDREMEHTERMKALEMGLTLPKDRPRWTPEKLPVAIGAGVPITALLIALIAGQAGAGGLEAWIAASIVGTAAVICGTTLAMSRRFDRNPSPEPVGRDSKPSCDPDAYDVVNRRG